MSFAAARENMVDSQIRTNDVTDPHLQAAMRAVPRERFCNARESVLAYAERECEVAEGRFLMKPRDVAKLLMAAAPRADERALVICEPYAAAVLARVGCEVTAVDTAAALGVVSGALAEEGVSARAADPAEAAGQGEYDLVIAGGAVSEPPAGWLAALAEGGRAAVVVRSGPVGRATIYLRAGGRTSGRAVFECTPPYLPGLEPRPAFVF